MAKRAARGAVSRFAPSPTGYLHLGHAYAALVAHGLARGAGGRFVLRIEDIDRGRCRSQFEAAIYEDLAWLGVHWETPVRRQSEHLDDYAAALSALDAAGLVYPCFCTRREIAAEIARSARAPHGPEGPVYPGTCRALSGRESARRRNAGAPFALRLDMARAAQQAGALSWTDLDRGEVAARPEALGDVVLARKDAPASYHLAVAVDDHLQGIEVVSRGADLFAATHVHRLLQALLGYRTPRYLHHRLVADAAGRRLAKRHDGSRLRALREAGRTPEEVRAMAGFAG